MLAPLNYELKLLVDPMKVLDDGVPTPAVQSSLKIDDSKAISMQFVDSARLDLRGAGWGWNVRIRAFSDHDKLELTYKKRYEINSTNTASSLLASAVQAGFDSDPAKYECQVEWGRDAKTLTLSTKTESAQQEPHPTDLPGERQSRQKCIEAIPFRLDQEKTRGCGPQGHPRRQAEDEVFAAIAEATRLHHGGDLCEWQIAIACARGCVRPDGWLLVE